MKTNRKRKTSHCIRLYRFRKTIRKSKNRSKTLRTWDWPAMNTAPMENFEVSLAEMEQRSDVRRIKEVLTCYLFSDEIRWRNNSSHPKVPQKHVCFGLLEKCYLKQQETKKTQKSTGLKKVIFLKNIVFLPILPVEKVLLYLEKLYTALRLQW